MPVSALFVAIAALFTGEYPTNVHGFFSWIFNLHSSKIAA